MYIREKNIQAFNFMSNSAMHPVHWPQFAYNLIVLNWLIGGNGLFEWRSSRCNTVGRLNGNIAWNNINYWRFDANPEFGIFLSNGCTGAKINKKDEHENKVENWAKQKHNTPTYLNTTSPMKSDGACHCREMPDFGEGCVWVAVLSNPPQFINFAVESAGGANRPT